MKLLGIYGSPRKGGNSDLLLDRALEGASSEGPQIGTVYVRDLKISGCMECNGCEKTGQCVIDDDMQSVYTLLKEARAIIVSTPIFFYGVTSQLKALIDRCQAMWSLRMIQKKGEARKTHHGGRGYIIAVGATKGKNLFEGAQLTARYFFDALDMDYEGGLFFSAIEGKGAILNHADALDRAFELGRKAARGISLHQRCKAQSPSLQEAAMNESKHCPGLEQFKSLKSFICRCPECGREKEIFSDELDRKHVCKGCGKELDLSACIQDGAA